MPHVDRKQGQFCLYIFAGIVPTKQSANRKGVAKIMNTRPSTCRRLNAGILNQATDAVSYTISCVPAPVTMVIPKQWGVSCGSKPIAAADSEIGLDFAPSVI